MKNSNDYKFEFLDMGRLPLTQRRLDEITKQIKDKYDLEVERIVEVEDGYVFKGKYNFTIGNLFYNKTTHSYEPFKYCQDVEKRIAAQESKEKKNKPKFVLKRGTIGKKIAPFGIAALIGLGVMTAHHFTAPEPEPTSIVVEHKNTLQSAPDVVVVDWANYAMNCVSEDCMDSKWEEVQSMRDSIYSDLFVPVMATYYHYLDLKDSDLPEEIIGNSVASKQSLFRSEAQELDDYLGTSFSNHQFANTPYADAVVLNEYGHEVTTSGTNSGELIDNNGYTIDNDNENIKVYIKYSEVAGEEELNSDKLPDDAVVYNNEVYVLTSHLYDTYNKDKVKTK